MVEINNKILVIIIIPLLFVGFFGYYVGYRESKANSELRTKLNVIKESVELEEGLYDVVDDSADAYYELASLSYEQFDWKGVETNCVLARDEYSDRTGKAGELKAGIDNSTELGVVMIKLLETRISIDWAMYEACEHFESASRYYEQYYNSNDYGVTPSYEMGSAEIENMNNKIIKHDELVLEYNDLWSEYNQKRLEILNGQKDKTK